MKKAYRTDLKRLVSFFESSRDKWKSRSHAYQAEKRALQTQVRDLRRSVEHWKNKYRELEEELKKKRFAIKGQISSYLTVQYCRQIYTWSSLSDCSCAD